MLSTAIIEKAFRQQENLLRSLQNADTESTGKWLEDFLFSLERLTVHVRQLVSTLPENRADCYGHGDVSADAFEISVFTDSLNGKPAYVIDLPFLLPNRRTSTSFFKRTIVQAIRKALRDFCAQNSIKPFEKASVTFVSFYVPNQNRKMRHDNDNTEISGVLNALTGLLIHDDSSLCCDLHILSRDGNKSFSRVIIEGIDF